MTEKDTIVVNKGKKSPEGARSFKSEITHHPTRGTQAYLPRPIMEKWGFPGAVIFTMQGDQVVMRRAKKE